MAPDRAPLATEWPAYEAAMFAARDAALDLADALERYARSPELHGCPCHRFEAACAAAHRWEEARQRAEPYHFAVVPSVSSSFVINADGPELVVMARELRGTPVPRSCRAGARALAGFVYATDGVAGFFTLEVSSMARFGAPRRKFGER